jgi:hypothetical protein
MTKAWDDYSDLLQPSSVQQEVEAGMRKIAEDLAASAEEHDRQYASEQDRLEAMFPEVAPKDMNDEWANAGAMMGRFFWRWLQNRGHGTNKTEEVVTLAVMAFKFFCDRVNIDHCQVCCERSQTEYRTEKLDPQDLP